MPLCEWEKTVTCPYNPAHQITIERIQWHLVKVRSTKTISLLKLNRWMGLALASNLVTLQCRKQHNTSEFIVCPYNASHHVPKPEEQYHLQTCSDRWFCVLVNWNEQKTHFIS